MRIFTVSDIHTNYSENQKWLLSLSKYDYTKDILIFAGDISHDISLIEEAFAAMSERFSDVFYVPGNHDFWVKRDSGTSFERFETLKQLADGYGIKRHYSEYDTFVIVPLLCWYDYSFGKMDKRLLSQWGDFFRCNFEGMKDAEVNDYFLRQNELPQTDKTIVSFSHFLPRIDVLSGLSRMVNFLSPVLGTTKLENVVRELPSRIHIYGHSHVNVYKWRDDVLYINNAFGYPRETHIAAKKLLDITYDVLRKG
ncbi:metallophosphoesterase [Candidatus Uabimicrobium amorphum]|uniref:Metallophosphoesterase n=1 Tax=Uabimicrobium amorphum TaxID=2596890 RepID=A0A5S9F1H9_UABAM|nr:metallophosphoesterase [Candidatus Uabimicrobium amorphum]BBM82083.1 metallophosphoesterase [Candidatus Uabimicrobium amorphum]